MRIYRRQPTAIRFNSPMVNDFNQHLCGGWHFSDIPDVHEATCQQLSEGRKPFACISYWQDEEADARHAKAVLHSMGLVTDLRQRDLKGFITDHVWDVMACHDIRVRDIGDLCALREDYAPIFEAGLETEQITLFADRALKSFFDGWDSPPLPLWLTGLILGYPVENTISLYLE